MPSSVIHYTPEHPDWDKVVKEVTPLDKINSKEVKGPYTITAEKTSYARARFAPAQDKIRGA